MRISTGLAVALALAFGAGAMADNVVQRENRKTGTTSWRLTNESSAGEIEGYASATSVARGSTIQFYVRSSSPSYTLEFYRMGWYGGTGARLLGSVSRNAVIQTIPSPDSHGKVECNWSDPYALVIPASSDATEWASGVYLVKLIAASGKQKYIPFVVRDDARPSNHYFVSSVTTAQAYNAWGGKSLYTYNSTNSQPAQKVSFNRPFDDGQGSGQFLLNWEYNMVRFLEREGYDVTYCSDVDLATQPPALLTHRDILFVGHPEYWSWEMRVNVEAARDAGVNLGFFSANSCFWQIRFEPSASDLPLRTIVGYKDSALSLDPYYTDNNTANDHLITTLWRNAPVNRPEAALVGTEYVYYPVRYGDIVIADVLTVPWIFADTGLAAGDVLVGLLGYEVDAVGVSSPANTTVLGHSPFTRGAAQLTPGEPGPEIAVPQTGTDFSDMTVYIATSGAVVFSTGTIQWSWGLDDWNWQDRGYWVNAAAAQMTRNLLQRFAGEGAQADCSFAVIPAAISVGPTATSANLTLTTKPHCLWAASSDASWLAVTAPTSGTGSSLIEVTIAQNGGTSRSATLTIADKTVAVTQSACTFTISPSADSIAAAGGTVSTMVTAANGCEWAALTNESWITVTNGASGVGDASVAMSVAANTGPDRSGTVTIAGRTFTVTQADGCVYSLSSSGAAVPAVATAGDFAVTASAAQCSWNASPRDAWVTVSPSSGAGSGTVTYEVAANGGVARATAIDVAGLTFGLTQPNGCTYSLDPGNVVVASTGGSASAQLGTTAGCTWTVENTEAWITITSPSSGSQSASITLTAQANSGASRVGTIRIGGQPLTVTQGATGAPAIVSAVAETSSRVLVTWSAVSGATSYEVARSTSGPPVSVVGATSATSLADGGVSPSKVYLYAVRAISAAGTSHFSNADVATTFAFSEPPAAPGLPIRAAHIVELRQVVDLVRAAAGLPPYAYADASLTGAPVRAAHLLDLRNGLATARSALALGGIAFTTPRPEGEMIRALHISELRDGVK